MAAALRPRTAAIEAPSVGPAAVGVKTARGVRMAIGVIIVAAGEAIMAGVEAIILDRPSFTARRFIVRLP